MKKSLILATFFLAGVLFVADGLAAEGPPPRMENIRPRQTRNARNRYDSKVAAALRQLRLGELPEGLIAGHVFLPVIVRDAEAMLRESQRNIRRFEESIRKIRKRVRRRPRHRSYGEEELRAWQHGLQKEKEGELQRNRNLIPRLIERRDEQVRESEQAFLARATANEKNRYQQIVAQEDRRIWWEERGVKYIKAGAFVLTIGAVAFIFYKNAYLRTLVGKALKQIKWRKS